MSVNDDQFDLGLSGRDRSPLMRRLAAMVAPVATDAGAVVDDDAALDIARAVCAAFAHDDAVGGLSKAEIAARVNGACTPAKLEQRLGVFVRMELLRPILHKKHQQRYVLAPSGLVGMLIVDRFAERGRADRVAATEAWNHRPPASHSAVDDRTRAQARGPPRRPPCVAPQ